MKRVAVIGAPGSGKSTFARRLGEVTGLPVIHMDYYHLDSNYDYPHDHEAWNELVRKLIARDEWITEGNYGATYDERFNRADTIIFLDYPRRTYLNSIAKRRIKHHNKRRPEMPEDWKEKTDWKFMQYVLKFQNVSVPKIKVALSKQKAGKVLIFKSRKEADNYLNDMINA